jgi:hypothetical protein
MYCKFLECGSMVYPPAACIAAVEPVAVLTHMPLDHTLKEKSSSIPGFFTLYCLVGDKYEDGVYMAGSFK